MPIREGESNNKYNNSNSLIILSSPYEYHTYAGEIRINPQATKHAFLQLWNVLETEQNCETVPTFSVSGRHRILPLPD